MSIFSFLSSNSSSDPLRHLQIKQITPDISVSVQVMKQDVPALAEAGFKSLICNRPDGEDRNQPPFSELAAVAKDAGLQIASVPVVSGRISESDAIAMHNAIESLPKPILAFCRSGARSTMLIRMADAV